MGKHSGFHQDTRSPLFSAKEGVAGRAWGGGLESRAGGHSTLLGRPGAAAVGRPVSLRGRRLEIFIVCLNGVPTATPLGAGVGQDKQLQTA